MTTTSNTTLATNLMRIGTAALAVGALVGCGDPPTPSELRPGFTSIIGLPFDLCTGKGTVQGTLLLRNIGDTLVTIDSVAFEAAAGQESELSSFDAPVLDRKELLADDEAFVVFDYRVPGGVEQNATLVITSDADVKPRLEVPVATQELVPDTPPNCG